MNPNTSDSFPRMSGPVARQYLIFCLGSFIAEEDLLDLAKFFLPGDMLLVF